jgi:hypothetical protein
MKWAFAAVLLAAGSLFYAGWVRRSRAGFIDDIVLDRAVGR